MVVPTVDFQQPLRMWLDFAANMAAAGASASAEAVPSDASRQVRDAYLRAIAQYTEEYMRSPQFLEMMKQSTDAAVSLRKQINDFVADAHRAMGSVARPDIDGLIVAVRRCETRVLEQLDELSGKLSDLETRLQALESAGKPARKSK